MTTEELTRRVETIDRRMNRLTTEIEELKDRQKLMRKNIQDMLLGMDLGGRTNQMIDGIHRNRAVIQRSFEAIDRPSAKQAETNEIVSQLAKTVDRYLNARLNGNN